jgi:hypothetical protein
MVVETHEELGLETSVSYVTVAGESCPGLLRSVVLKNIGQSVLDLELLDGMPVIVPAGVNDFSLKKQRRITEAFCRASLFNGSVGLFAPPATIVDSAEVSAVKEATFYGAWIRSNRGREACALIVDPDVVFGAGEDFIRPHRFAGLHPIDFAGQNWENRLPCAFAHATACLKPGEELRLDALSGFASDRALLADFLKSTASDPDSVLGKAREVVDSITLPALTATALPRLDGYVQQNYLDNVLRGGTPMMLPSADGQLPVHVYTRRHGDMERDYNDFNLPPYPYSEGSGNFRDILQNRRNDIFFNPGIGEAELRSFLSLLQPDGYNPLAVEGYRWRAESQQLVDDLVPPTVTQPARDELARIITRHFAPGEVMMWARYHLAGTKTPEEFMRAVLERCRAEITFKASHEGFWIDHWIYLLDMLEAYQGIYPDRLRTLLVEPAKFPWGPCLYGLVKVDDRFELQKLVAPATLPAMSLLVRLVALAAIKSVTLDREGRGMEMEAGRPGWNDALNGLPGLGGSSMCETAALLRLCEWLIGNWPQEQEDVELPVVLKQLLLDAQSVCSAPVWNYEAALTAREVFRRDLYDRSSRDLVSVGIEQLRDLVVAIAKCTARAIDSARDASGVLLHTYFHRGLNAGQTGEPTSLPLFLEGQVHLLRLQGMRTRALDLYRSVRGGALFDRELKMYKLNESLLSCPQSIGRARTFTPGMYENESIWLHMSYKYLLEILRSGLYEEFFADCRTMLVPFMNPEVYGRSILENSSFICSSTMPEAAVRGRGFVARLSGSTAEFIHIWLILTVGERPFRMRQGELALEFNPVLPGEWFREEESLIRFGGEQLSLPAGALCTVFLGEILLVYHNPQRADTFGRQGVRPVSLRLDGVDHPVPTLVGSSAELVRNRQIRRIDVLLG